MVDFYGKELKLEDGVTLIRFRNSWKVTGKVKEISSENIKIELDKNKNLITLNKQEVNEHLAVDAENFEFDYLRKNGFLLYEYIRGSKLYGLARPESDEDHGGVFIEPIEAILGTGIGFPEDVHDATNDESWYGLGKYLKLLLNSNPNVLESLYIPEDKIIYKHPLMDKILSHRDEFLTKKCFGSFMGYAKTQLERARSLKKKIVHPIEGPLQSCLEFILYEENGGSKKVVDWLKVHGLKQEYCGLVSLDRMICMYCMYYDWGQHIYNELGIAEFNQFLDYIENNYDPDSAKITDPFLQSFVCMNSAPGSTYILDCYSKGDKSFWKIDEEAVKLLWDYYNKPFGYKGLVNKQDTSNQVRLSSIPKGEKAILNVSYNKDGYSGYCRQYKEYHDFKKHHNPERFNLAKEKQFDRKNACHSARLLNMGIEIARGEGCKIDRTNIDREFLMNIRLGNTDYDSIMKYLNGKDAEMKEAMQNSTIPDEISLEFINNLLIEIRREFYGI